MVARQFIAWNVPMEPRPVGHGVIGYQRRVNMWRCAWMVRKIFGRDIARLTIHTVPYGTDLIRRAFQAINCLATIIRSLRDTPNAERQTRVRIEQRPGGG